MADKIFQSTDLGCQHDLVSGNPAFFEPEADVLFAPALCSSALGNRIPNQTINKQSRSF